MHAHERAQLARKSALQGRVRGRGSAEPFPLINQGAEAAKGASQRGPQVLNNLMKHVEIDPIVFVSYFAFQNYFKMLSFQNKRRADA